MSDAKSSDDWRSLLKFLMLKVNICIFFELFKNLGFRCPTIDCINIMYIEERQGVCTY